ncbi:putative transmembrane protein UsgS [Ophiocordyceps camponoti-floridani]|uniref:Putative transmembrane protein UsgS n=1 Tax=Ophiocordyceps camponoti-floridani TaxID=2030778 RepID=A0A8H4Q7U8_9HYPO|nr:putative transmembrane protein UsgS [Ophiocordyceps camponoti-floridani]
MASFRKTPVNTRSWLDISHFSPNAILRGVQLTFVGAHRSLQNPALFTSDHYRQAAHALAAGIAIRLLVEIPNICVKVLKWCMAFFYPEDRLSWLGAVSDDVGFIGNHVLQLPLFFMAVMQHLSPTLDELFMQSLKWS